jgi:hypothetical protein
MRTIRRSKHKRRSRRKLTRRQKGGAEELISGATFKSLCKYNLDDRYKIIPYDAKLVEGDRVFMKLSDVQTKFLNSPPSKKITLIIHNSDETFTDELMEKVKPYVTQVYAANCSATGAKQIPLGFRDDQYTPHRVLYDVLNDTSKSSKKATLCLVNFNVGTNGGERAAARDNFKGKPWATLSDEYMNLNKGKSLQHSDPEIQKIRAEYYTQLKGTKFVICPPGTGMDTHRVYEALFFGAVPVIKTSFLDPMYERLGGCWIVKDWSEVTEEACNSRWANVNRPKIDFGARHWLEVAFTNGGSQPLKVAILLSGRIKGYESVKKNLENIVNTYHPVFFVSLNKKNKSPYIETFCKEYHITDDRLHLEIAKTPEYLKTLKKAKETPVDGTYSMFYNTHMAFKMLEKYQDTNRMQFDCILFYRADIDSTEMIHLVKPANRTIYIPTGDDYGGLNGLVAYGDFNTMKVYCDLVNAIHKNVRRSGRTISS